LEVTAKEGARLRGIAIDLEIGFSVGTEKPGPDGPLMVSAIAGLPIALVATAVMGRRGREGP
jgi:hypothetical protein